MTQILAAPPRAVRPEDAGPTARVAKPAWRRAMRDAVRDPAELCRLLGLPDELAERAAAATHDFPLLVPRGYVERMNKGDADDPLLRQVLPLEAEMVDAAGFVADPVGDADAERSPGLLHKYRGRVLLVTTGSCAVHCRYCFRRHYPYGEATRGDAWSEALEQIAADPSIHEVILSGGDPLMLGDSALAGLVGQIESIPHVRRLRVHTRLPIMIP
ncbi:MAG: 4Fe-4S cluster-binding domain-containing protein, partial [Planctomycetota bacterium]